MLVAFSRNQTPRVSVPLKKKSPSQSRFPSRVRSRRYPHEQQSVHEHQEPGELLFLTVDLQADPSTFLQDQFGHPLVQASTLLTVGSYFLKPAVVSLGVLYRKRTQKYIYTL